MKQNSTADFYNFVYMFCVYPKEKVSLELWGISMVVYLTQSFNVGLPAVGMCFPYMSSFYD